VAKFFYLKLLVINISLVKEMQTESVTTIYIEIHGCKFNTNNIIYDRM